MKIAIVLARGVEGCGVTKFTVELEKWCESVGHRVTVLASRDKRWSRQYAHKIKNLVHQKFASDEEFEVVLEECRSSDLVIINSLPSLSHSEECQRAYSKILELRVPKVVVQHDHNKLSMKRNALLKETIDAADVIFAHSRNGDFAEFVQVSVNQTGPLDSFFDTPTDDNKKILTFQPGMDFKSVRDSYWRHITKTDSRNHKWIGRTTFWKGFGLMFNYHDSFLREMGVATSLEGIEKSPAYLDLRQKFEHLYEDRLGYDADEFVAKDHYGAPAVIYSTYDNHAMLNRMSKCGFGYQLSLLAPKYIEQSLEYTHYETVCTGVIPVFRKEYGDQCVHRHYGKSLTDFSFEESGTLWLSDTNMKSVAGAMRDLFDDSAARDEAREAAYKFYSWYDSKYTFEEMFDKIKKEV